jgi:cytochrome c-type biogenesis protein CcmH
VFAFMVARYGDYVLLKPPFKPGTLVLWLGGPLVLLVAGGALLLAARKRRVAETPAPLTEEERERVASLLGTRHGGDALIAGSDQETSAASDEDASTPAP